MTEPRACDHLEASDSERVLRLCLSDAALHAVAYLLLYGDDAQRQHIRRGLARLVMEVTSPAASARGGTED